MVPHEYPNILSNAASTSVFDDDENTGVDVVIGGSGGSLRFPNIISPVDFIVSFAIDAAILVGPFFFVLLYIIVVCYCRIVAVISCISIFQRKPIRNLRLLVSTYC